MLVHPVSFSQLSTPYEQLSRRIHRQVNSSAAQLNRRTTIVRQPDERMDDWDKFVEELDVEESVRVTRLEEGSVFLSWTNQHCSSYAGG